MSLESIGKASKIIKKFGATDEAAQLIGGAIKNSGDEAITAALKYSSLSQAQVEVAYKAAGMEQGLAAAQAELIISERAAGGAAGKFKKLLHTLLQRQKKQRPIFRT